MSLDKVEKLIKETKAEFVDLRFVDLRGVQQHVTFPINIVEPGLFEEGKMFDGSSISGWKGINESDMVLMPDADTAYLDSDHQPHLRRAGPGHHDCVLALPAWGGQARRGVPAVLGHRRPGLLRPGAGVLHLRLGALCQRHGQHLLQGRFGRGGLEFRRQVRRRQQRLPAGRQGRLLPGPADRLAARHPRRDGQDPRTGRHLHRGPPPRSGHRRPVRDRHPLQLTGQEGRRAAGDEVHRQERGLPQRQDRHLHAQADRRRQRQWHARAPVAGQGWHQPVHRRRLRRPVAAGAVVHRRRVQACQGDQRPAPTATSAWSRASKRR